MSYIRMRPACPMISCRPCMVVPLASHVHRRTSRICTTSPPCCALVQTLTSLPALQLRLLNCTRASASPPVTAPPQVCIELGMVSAVRAQYQAKPSELRAASHVRPLAAQSTPFHRRNFNRCLGTGTSTPSPRPLGPLLGFIPHYARLIEKEEQEGFEGCYIRAIPSLPPPETCSSLSHPSFSPPSSPSLLRPTARTAAASPTANVSSSTGTPSARATRSAATSRRAQAIASSTTAIVACSSPATGRTAPTASCTRTTTAVSSRLIPAMSSSEVGSAPLLPTQRA